MRYTFYSAAAFAALLGEQTVKAIRFEYNSEEDDYAELDGRPVYEQDFLYAQAAADAEGALDLHDGKN